MIRKAGLGAVAALFLSIALVLAACGSGEEANPEAAQPEIGKPQAAQEDNAAAPGSGLAQASLDRKIIQSASLELQVADVAQTYAEVTTIAQTAGGFVLESNSASSDDRPAASLTIRVPVSQYGDVMGQLRGLATKVEKESSKAQDVTEEYTDLQARLRSYQALETRYIELLDQAQNIDEVLKVQDRLTQVRTEIETLQGRANAIDTLSELVTISVHLQAEPPAEEGGDEPDPLGAASKAWEASLTTLRALATGIVWFVVYLWWFLPLVAVGGIVSYIIVRRDRSRRTRGNP